MYAYVPVLVGELLDSDYCILIQSQTDVEVVQAAIEKSLVGMCASVYMYGKGCIL